MTYTNDTAKSSPETSPETTPEAEQGKESISTGRFASQRELMQFKGSGYTPGALTSTTILRLQRTIGNQATGRLIQRELNKSKKESLIQRIATDNRLLGETGQENSARSKGFFENKQALDFSTIEVAEFKTNKKLQATVFNIAQKTVDNQLSLGNGILSGLGLKEVSISALKKRDTLPGFVKGVIEKCESKPYKKLSQMDDMARGRFETTNKADMKKIVGGLQTQTKVITAPRKTKDGVTSYPRYHIITMDSTGMSFEWQVGTKATTDLYEAEEIIVPPSLITEAEKAKKHLKPKANIHDISYAVFQRMVNKYPEIAETYKVAEFVKKVNLASQTSGDLGESTTEFKGEISELLVEATKLLTVLVENGATPQIVSLLH